MARTLTEAARDPGFVDFVERMIEYTLGSKRPLMPNEEIVDRVYNAVQSVDPSLGVRVYSGRYPKGKRYGSPRHGTGNTIDFYVMRDGDRVPTNDPVHAQIVGQLPAHGINEIGVGLGVGGIHAGFGTPNRPPAMWGYPGGSSAALKRYPEHVKAVQQTLGVAADGVYGGQTRNALAAVDTAASATQVASVPAPRPKPTPDTLRPGERFPPGFPVAEIPQVPLQGGLVTPRGIFPASRPQQITAGLSTNPFQQRGTPPEPVREPITVAQADRPRSKREAYISQAIPDQPPNVQAAAYAYAEAVGGTNPQDFGQMAQDYVQRGTKYGAQLGTGASVAHAYADRAAGPQATQTVLAMGEDPSTTLFDVFAPGWMGGRGVDRASFDAMARDPASARLFNVSADQAAGYGRSTPVRSFLDDLYRGAERTIGQQTASLTSTAQGRGIRPADVSGPGFQSSFLARPETPGRMPAAPPQRAPERRFPPAGTTGMETPFGVQIAQNAATRAALERDLHNTGRVQLGFDPVIRAPRPKPALRQSRTDIRDPVPPSGRIQLDFAPNVPAPRPKPALPQDRPPTLADQYAMGAPSIGLYGTPMVPSPRPKPTIPLQQRVLAGTARPTVRSTMAPIGVRSPRPKPAIGGGIQFMRRPAPPPPQVVYSAPEPAFSPAAGGGYVNPRGTRVQGRGGTRLQLGGRSRYDRQRGRRR